MQLGHTGIPSSLQLQAWGHRAQPHAHQFPPNTISFQMRVFTGAPFARFECCTLPDPPHSHGGKLRHGLCPPMATLAVPHDRVVLTAARPDSMRLIIPLLGDVSLRHL